MVDMQGRSHEDPLREVATLQYLSDAAHPNVLQCIEVREEFMADWVPQSIASVVACKGLPSSESGVRRDEMLQ